MLGDTCRCTEYALPGSLELAEQCVEALGKEANACLIHSHGPCVWERTWRGPLRPLQCWR